jgi:hypothetical protein
MEKHHVLDMKMPFSCWEHGFESPARASFPLPGQEFRSCSSTRVVSKSRILEGPAIRGKSYMTEYTRRPEEKPCPFPCLAGSKLDRPADNLAADVCKKIAHSPRKLLREKNCSRNLLTLSKFIVSKNLLNKFAHGQ